MVILQTTGIILKTDTDTNTRKLKISLLVDVNNKEVVEKLKSENKLCIELKKWRQKRSLDANSYCWVLCDKIAKELCKDGTIVTKEDVYKDAILQIGSFEPFIVQEKTYMNFKRIWEKQGLGFLVQEVSKKDKCIKVNCYYGSSTYNTKEMSLLIECIVELAKTLNIETKPQSEIDKNRIKMLEIEYDESFIKNEYLPKLEILTKCLKEGGYPANNRNNT